jgi:transcriptional regulator with XRE-family HTH domain
MGDQVLRKRSARRGLISQAPVDGAHAFGQVELAELAGLGINTVKRVELSEEITGSARTLWKIQTAAGVEFIPADETKGPGVRLKRRKPGKQAKRSGAGAKG